ncbi:SLC22A18 [Symbiodinium natans]|uniref:SLC22A18 protein n=1 Tax=Symbiodinium natans TaxID=878477 RepID=A0A812V043_9DINO|nr:SLC22A18 [Symbiodinium natans]
MFALLSDALFQHAGSCLERPGRRKAPPAQEEPQQLTFAQRCADFLGAKEEPEALQRLLVAHGTQAVYATAAEASLVVLPYINGQVGGDVQSFAQMSAVASAVQFIGGLAFGRMTDRKGSFWALMTAHGASLGSAFLVANATSKHQLMAAMLPLAMAHGFQASSQIAVTSSTPETRAVAMGRISMTYGAGFFAGTLVTSAAARRLSTRQIAWAAVFLEAGAIAVVAMLYPPDEGAGSQTTDTAGERDFRQLLRRPQVVPLLLSKLANATSGGMLLCMINQFAMDPFSFSASQTSLLMAYVSGVQLLSQGCLVPLLARLSPKSLRLASSSALALPLVGLAAFGTSPAAYVFWLGPLTSAVHGGGTAMGSMLSCLAPDSESGAMVALSMAPLSLGFLLSPLLASWVYQHFGFRMVPAVACGGLLAMTALVELCAEAEIPEAEGCESEATAS